MSHGTSDKFILQALRAKALRLKFFSKFRSFHFNSYYISDATIDFLKIAIFVNEISY